MNTGKAKRTSIMLLSLTILAGCVTTAATEPTDEERYTAKKRMADCLLRGTIEIDDGRSSAGDVGAALMSICRDAINATAATWGRGLSAGAMRQLVPKVNKFAAELAVETVLRYRVPAQASTQIPTPPVKASTQTPLPVKKLKTALPNEKRIALVIGNGDYNVGRLANPASDARLSTIAVADPLREGLAAYSRLRPLAEQGDASAQFTIGVMFGEGQGVPQNYFEAVKWFRKAAEQGDASGQAALGDSYLRGEGVSQDYGLAAKWFRLSAKQGIAPAQYQFGIMNERGDGVPQDYAEAAAWFKKSAAQGYVLAQTAIGLAYANGNGVLQDFVQAYMWSNLAAAQGDKRARKARDIVANIMTPAQLAEAQRLSREWKPN